MSSEITATEIAVHYVDCLDMVNLINTGHPAHMDYPEWEATLSRSKEFLTDMMGRDFWTTEDLSPLEKAIER